MVPFTSKNKGFSNSYLGSNNILSIIFDSCIYLCYDDVKMIVSRITKKCIANLICNYNRITFPKYLGCNKLYLFV